MFVRRVRLVAQWGRLLLAFLLVLTAALILACGGLPTDRGSVAPEDKKPADQGAKNEVSAEYGPKIAAARLRMPEDEKLIAAQKEVIAAQPSVYRREEAQRKLKELEDKLEEDRKAIDRLLREEQEERNRDRIEAEQMRKEAQADAERQRKEAERERNDQAQKEAEQAAKEAARQQFFGEVEKQYGPVFAAAFEKAFRERIERTRKEIEEIKAQYQPRIDQARAMLKQTGDLRYETDLDALERTVKDKINLCEKEAIAEAQKKAIETEDASGIVTLRKYHKVEAGMDYRQVSRILVLLCGMIFSGVTARPWSGPRPPWR